MSQEAMIGKVIQLLIDSGFGIKYNYTSIKVHCFEIYKFYNEEKFAADWVIMGNMEHAMEHTMQAMKQIDDAITSRRLIEEALSQ